MAQPAEPVKIEVKPARINAPGVSMRTVSVQPKMQSFVQGVMMPVPGMKALEKQIHLEIGGTSGKSTIYCFALGHMAVAYPVILGAGYLFYTIVEMLF